MDAATSDTLETVIVIGVTPMPDRGVPATELPGRATVFDWQRIERTQALDLSQFLNRSHGSVFINEAQNNPLQPDVQLRGFTASPLLGLPQGLAVYQDGVRINEPFGDTVNWALIPQNAIERITVMPGSNPVFGMNALGGALAVDMKNGFDHRGTQLRALAGDFTRSKVDAQSGGTINDRLAWFAAGSHLDEDGWRDFSPTRATQAFADLRYRSDATTVALSVTRADTHLIGNGPAPAQLLAVDREAIFTRPDLTRNRMSLLTLSGRHDLRKGLALDVVAAYRRSEIHTLNGDDSDFESCEDEPELVCEDENEIAFDQSGTPIAFGPEVEGATINRSHTQQDSYSLSAQLSLDTRWGAVGHRASIGASVDYNDVRFDSSTELGRLDATRNALGSGSYVLEAFTDLNARSTGHGVYIADVMQLSPRVSANVAGRFNINTVTLRDQLGVELNGDHRFSRFNPAVGITWQAWDAVQLYASVGEASRAPTPVELTCADPDDPCRLPNAFLSDPPLQQVVSRTVEAGARGRVADVNWHLGLFSTVNRDDILFISAGALTNQGYFDNVGRTRRRGVELSLNGESEQGRLSWFLDATLIDAEFREHFAVASANNPLAENDEITVTRGDRIPSVPRGLVKAGIDVQVTPRWSIGADYNYSSSQYLRGDEGNLTPPLRAHGVVNLRSTLQITHSFELFALVENVTGERYATFGTFGEPDEVLGDDYSDTRFISPGHPRGFWIGASVEWR